MGLDLSMTGTGLVVIQGTKVATWRLLETEPVGQAKSVGLLPSGKYRGETDARIEWTVSTIRKAWNHFLPDLTVIEEYAFGAKGRGLSSLHEQGGVVRNFLFRKEAPYITEQNSRIKEFATGKGGASKDEMIAAATDLWRGCPQGKGADNVADAFHLAMYGMTNYKALVQSA